MSTIVSRSCTASQPTVMTPCSLSVSPRSPRIRPAIAVELIEVQSGHYLGEDDIVRLEDVYNRSEEPESGPPASTRALATSRAT